jgi:hypothetical protein
METMTKQPKVASRLSVPLTDKDYADLALIRNSPERLRELGEDLSPSSGQAALVHAVFEEGMRSIKERAVEEAYEAMARDEELAREARANRKRLSRRGRDVELD